MSEYKTGETHEEVSRRWAREHIERSPDVAFTEKFRRFAYGDVVAQTLERQLDALDEERELERELREQFT